MFGRRCRIVLWTGATSTDADRHMNHFGVWMACGALAAMIYILLVAPAQQQLGIESTHQAGFISALLFLVPGFRCGRRDLSR